MQRRSKSDEIYFATTASDADVLRRLAEVTRLAGESMGEESVPIRLPDGTTGTVFSNVQEAYAARLDAIAERLESA